MKNYLLFMSILMFVFSIIAIALIPSEGLIAFFFFICFLLIAAFIYILYAVR